MKKLTLLFAFVLAATFCSAQDAEKVLELIREGVELHDKGDFQGAISKYDKALKLDEDNLYALAEKAMSLLSLEKYDKAIQCCEKVVEAHPGDKGLKTVYVTWANALDAQSKPEEAIEVYDKGIEAFPDSFLLHFNKGITLNGLDKTDEAILCFQQAVIHNPSHASSHHAMGRLLYSQKKNIPALLALGRFMVLEPEGDRAKGNLELINEIMFGHTKKTGKNNYTISMDPGIFLDTTENGKPKENSFGSLEMIFSISAALEIGEKKKSDTEKLQSRYTSLADLLKENQKENYGFYWDYYVPYFLAMKEENLMENFAYIAYASSGEKAVNKWIKKNSDEITRFYTWSKEFEWKY